MHISAVSQIYSTLLALNVTRLPYFSASISTTSCLFIKVAEEVVHSYCYQLTLWICTHSLKCWPLSMDRHPAPPPNPYPLGPYLRPWQFLQNSTDSCSLQFVESRALEHMPGEGGKKEELVTKSAEIIPINF